MINVLDNFAWHALNTHNSHLSLGDSKAKYFIPQVSPFAGLPEYTQPHFDNIAELVPGGYAFVFFDIKPIPLPNGWKEIGYTHGVQMTYDGKKIAGYADAEIINLTEANVDDMLALTALTSPGPFMQRTIEFGTYNGIFANDKLVAMAGQRMHADNYTEISAVCTNPDYTGRGYARELLAAQVNRMLDAGNTPILHARKDNYRALQVYESLGFTLQSDIHFHFLEKI